MDSSDVDTRTVDGAQAQVSKPSTSVEAPVLVAVDFSPDSEAAVVWACEYAEKVGAPLEILHVIHDPADAPGSYKPENGDQLEPMADVAERKLAAFLERVGGTHPALAKLETARSHCTVGLPASTILQVAEAHGAQHLVVGHRQRKGIARILHGSTANQVAGHARLPVTVVKADG